MAFNKQAEAKRLQSEGKDHLGYLFQLRRTDFDVTVDLPEGSTEKEIDEAVDIKITEKCFQMLEVHKENCDGCTFSTIKALKKKVGWK